MATKFLSHIPQPLLEDLVTGKWLPVIGAGLSCNAVVSSGKTLPLWNDLGETLSQEMKDYPYSGALDAISAYEHEYGRPKLIERLTDLTLIEEAQPGDAHRAFCSIPFDLVFTTNFDFLLERQYEASNRYCRPVIDEDQLSVNPRESGLLLLKLHGDLHHPNRLVLTEDDYDGFLANYPLLATYVANLLITRTAVLVGYSLDDPDFRQLWHIVSERLGKARRLAYALVVGARSTDVARYARRGVKVVNLPGSRSRYGPILAKTFDELREYMRENVIAVSKVTKEEPLRELSLPREAVTRLCFFAVPLELLPFYRDRVFPVVREAGLVPITADDVISPGDNISAKVDALIDRSSVMVVEVSSRWTLAELRLANARANEREPEPKDPKLGDRPKGLHIIVVARDPKRVPSDVRGVRILQRPDVLKEDVEPFLSNLEAELAAVAEKQGSRLSDEPLRLLNAAEFRAAVTSAVTLLETTLGDCLRRRERLTDRWLPLRSLIKLAESEGLIAPGSGKRASLWYSVRNQVVHSHASVSKAKAGEIVNGIMEIVSHLQGQGT